jgi:hypothetical protein
MKKKKVHNLTKSRVTIPVDVAAKIKFDSDFTCCKCRERGKACQIHHIDENPSNNNATNLALLCLECHNTTQVIGGFGRGLDAAAVTQSRDDWFVRVQKRRDKADELAAYKMSGVVAKDRAIPGGVETRANPSNDAFHAYAFRLPLVVSAAHSEAAKRWPGSSTADMMESQYSVIDVLRQILVNLADWYPENHFGNTPAQDYFSQYVSARFVWHRAVLEPEGAGRGGTIVGPMAAAAVLSDLQCAVRDIVAAHCLEWPEKDWELWVSAWK